MGGMGDAARGGCQCDGGGPVQKRAAGGGRSAGQQEEKAVLCVVNNCRAGQWYGWSEGCLGGGGGGSVGAGEVLSRASCITTSFPPEHGHFYISKQARDLVTPTIITLHVLDSGDMHVSWYSS